MRLETRGEKWIRLDEVESTNSYLLNEGRDLDSGSVVLARTQSAGRGRSGRVWMAVPGRAFIFSGLLRMNARVLPAGRMILVPLLCGIAVLRGAEEALRRFAPERSADVFSIKWPNDVYMVEGSKGERFKGAGFKGEGFGKLAGILVETEARGDEMSLVLGVGLNWRGLPDPGAEYRVAPAALFEADEITENGDAFTEFFVRAFNERVEQLLKPETPAFMAEIREHFHLLNRLVKMNGRAYRVDDFLDDGALALRDVETGEKNLVYDAPDDMQVL